MTTVTIKVDLVETHEHSIEIEGIEVQVHQHLFYDTSVIAIETEDPESIPPEFQLEATTLNHVIVELGALTYEEWEPSNTIADRKIEKTLRDRMGNDEVLTAWQQAGEGLHLYTTVTNWEFLS